MHLGPIPDSAAPSSYWEPPDEPPPIRYCLDCGNALSADEGRYDGVCDKCGLREEDDDAE